MPNPIIHLDEHGTFIEDVLYELIIPFSIEHQSVLAAVYSVDEGTIISDRLGKHLWAESLPRYEKVKTCPENTEHVTGRRLVQLLVDLYGWEDDTGITCDKNGTHWFVGAQLADQLREAKFTGMRFNRVTISTNQSPNASPQLVWIEPTGAKCRREVTIDVPKPNVCPFCGAGPVVCPSCRHYDGECRQCQQIMFVSERDWMPGDKRFTVRAGRLRGEPLKRSIVDAVRWDGSDVMPGTYEAIVSRRVVDFLVGAHVGPLIARPVKVNIDGASQQVLERLEKAKSA